jgi:nucleotide-binding universal stress UspA family protein
MYQNILVPLDGSKFAEHAVPMAAAVARSRGGRICLFQAMPPLSDRYFWAPEPGSQLDADLHERYREEAISYLNRIAGQISGLEVHYKLLDEHVDVPEAIEAEVKADGTDLVVMASHDRQALDRFWLGNVTDNLYRTAGSRRFAASWWHWMGQPALSRSSTRWSPSATRRWMTWSCCG